MRFPLGKALQSVKAAIEHDCQLAFGFPHRPFQQWIMAARYHRWTFDAGLSRPAAPTVLHDPELDERFWEQPFTGDADTRNAALAHKVINLALLDPQVISDFPR